MVEEDEKPPVDLKKYDIRTLENIIAETLSKLTGSKMECSINDISYGSSPDMTFKVEIRHETAFLKALKSRKS